MDKRENVIDVQHRRQELQQEVALLQKMLENGERVHQVLEAALLPTPGTTLQIPSFLPQKAKELLAELVMVEEEITRLEGEISKIQDKLKDNQEAREVLKSNQERHGSPIDPPRSNALQEKLALDTKPMFFIDQAIRGDYSIVGSNNKEKSANLVESTNKKKNQSMIELQYRVPRKSGIIENAMTFEVMEKPPSSRRSGIIEKQPFTKVPPRHQMTIKPKPSKEIISNSLGDPSSIISVEKSYQKWQPNKLSEKIMKCLICIFLRLIRTSRAAELEKSGNLLRSTLSRSSRIRADNLNLNASVNIQREMGQQDPYGIFEIEGSFPRDIGPYKNLVKITSGSFDLKAISNSLPLLNTLRALIISLQHVNLRLLTTHQQKLAFWINIHNACIMHGFLGYGLTLNTSQNKLNTLRNKAMLNIGGHELNATTIEQYILRQPSNADFEGDSNETDDAIRSIYGLEHPEPNVSFALSRGYRSSPAVKIYTAESILLELEKSKVDYLQASIVVTNSKMLIPKLLFMKHKDFAEDLTSLMDWICNQLPTFGSLRKSISECLRGQNMLMIHEVVDIAPYHVEFQYLLPN